MDLSNMSERQRKDTEEIVALLKRLKAEEDMQQASGISLPVIVENQSSIVSLGAKGYDAREAGSVYEGSVDYYDLYDDEDDFEEEDYSYSDESSDTSMEVVYDKDQTNYALIPYKFIAPKNATREQVREARREFNKKPIEDLNDEANFKKLMDMLDSSILPKKKQTTSLKDSMIYSKDSYEIPGIDGSKSFKRVGAKVDWKFDSVDIGANFNKLCKLVTEELINRFGGLSNIKKIYVHDNQMIINDVCFMPVIQSADYSSFPLDSADYIMNGCTAPFFKWVYLTKMPNLTYLGFSDTSFLLTTVYDSMGVGRKGGMETLFRLCKKLDGVSYSEHYVTRDMIEGRDNSEKGKLDLFKAREHVAYKKRFTGLFDGYSLNVYNGTNGVQNWCVNNLVDYAHNRGNKGIFAFSFGLLGRGVMALGATGVNAGTHLAGGIFKKVSDVWRSATTPVSDSDAGL